MNYNGLIIGLSAFVIIGLFHPVVIKTEYYFGKRAWPFFLILGILGVIASLLVMHSLLSPIAGIFGFSSLWSIHELIEQEERVKKGWFPSNPNKKK